MNWGRFDEAAWWWEYALDGVIGGVIGGVVTGLAVWLTLRHERRLAGRAELRADRASDRAEARVLAARVLSRVVRTRDKVERMAPDAASWKTETRPDLVDFVDDLAALGWVLNRHWPSAGREVRNLAKQLNTSWSAARSPGDKEFGAVWVPLAQAMGKVMEDPARLEKDVKTPPAQRGRQS